MQRQISDKRKKQLVAIGHRLGYQRDSHFIPRKAIAIDCGVDVDTVGRWERGEAEFGVTRLLAICESIGCKSSDILGI